MLLIPTKRAVKSIVPIRYIVKTDGSERRATTLDYMVHGMNRELESIRYDIKHVIIRMCDMQRRSTATASDLSILPKRNWNLWGDTPAKLLVSRSSDYYRTLRELLFYSFNQYRNATGRSHKLEKIARKELIYTPIFN